MKQTKRLLSSFLTFCLLLGLLPTTAWAAGDITTISSAEELKALAEAVNGGTSYEGQTITLTADIDLGGSVANPWTPIGTKSDPFKGIFDGGGHKITGLYIASDVQNCGLFGYLDVGGTVKNLGVEGSVTCNYSHSNVSGYSGGVVGYNVGTVEHCYYIGSVSGTQMYNIAGGVVGSNGSITEIDDNTFEEVVLASGTARGCYHIGGDVSCLSSAGGVVGLSYGTVENCYNTGAARNANYSGGVVGQNYGGTVKNCYNTGMVSGKNRIGGVVGWNRESTSVIKDCCFQSGKASTAVGKDDGTTSNTGSKTEGDFKEKNAFSGWDFTSVWKMSTALGRPILINNPEPEPHSHTWDTAWTTNDTHHWHECTAEGCDITDYATCGEADAAYAAHTGGTATCQAKAVCTACGQEYGSLNSSNHTNLTHTASVPATCTAYGVKEYWTCSGCGKHFSDASGTTEIADLNTWKSGDGKIETIAHDFDGDYLFDASGHWHKCANCDATDTKENHRYDNDQDTTCNDCDYTRTVTPPDDGEVKGEVEAKPGAPVVKVDEEALKELAGTPQTGETVTVTLTVEKKAENAAEGAQEIKQVATGKRVDFLDLSLVKTVTGGSSPGSTTITNAAKVLEIVVSYDFSGKKDVTVYRKHGTESAVALDELTSIPGTPADGKFYADRAGGKLYIYAAKFSTYAIGYTPEGGGNSGGSGGSGSGGWSGGGSSSGSGGSVTDKPAPGEVSSCFRDKTCPVWSYTDASVSAWYHDGIHYCVQNGLMVGTDSTHFSPGTTASRAMIAAILWRLEGEPKAGAVQPFSDVADDRWYTQAIAWAAETGVVKGYGEGRFGPNDPITREQLASLLWRYAGNPAAADLPLSFTDAGEASGYAQDALRWAVDQGILTGKGGGVLDPRGMATRAEAAQMLMRFCLSRK